MTKECLGIGRKTAQVALADLVEPVVDKLLGCCWGRRWLLLSSLHFGEVVMYS